VTIDEHNAVVKMAVELFECVNAKGACSEDDYAKAFMAALGDILGRHPEMPIESLTFAAGVAFGRLQARKRCGCLKSESSRSPGRLQ